MASVSDLKVFEADTINPMGTDGFEFVEYTAPDPAALGALFESMGFVKVAKHRSKDVSLFRQGDVNFIINAEPDSFAQGFARVNTDVRGSGKSGGALCLLCAREQRSLAVDALIGQREIAFPFAAVARHLAPAGHAPAAGLDGDRHPLPELRIVAAAETWPRPRLQISRCADVLAGRAP